MLGMHVHTLYIYIYIYIHIYVVMCIHYAYADGYVDICTWIFGQGMLMGAEEPHE